tara:strand:- start:68 stop:784 length:717 start_codon:yes stop_codon:yes gene_type:complete
MLKVSSISKKLSNRIGLLGHKKISKNILSDVSFNSAKGESIALMGQNGSGKTTLLKIISGILEPDKGKIYVENKLDNKKTISIINANERSFFWRLSVIENLKFFNSKEKIESLAEFQEYVELLDLKDILNNPYMTLSTGEKKRVSLFRALLKKSDIFLMDEATNGLDIQSQISFLDLIKNLLNKGIIKVLIFSTHSIHDVSNLANRIILLKNGKIRLDNLIDNMQTEQIKNLLLKQYE